MNLINCANGADDAYPSWSDSGKRIKVYFEDKMIVGVLEMDEVYNNAADDVDTLYHVRDADGVMHDMMNADGWELV